MYKAVSIIFVLNLYLSSTFAQDGSNDLSFNVMDDCSNQDVSGFNSTVKTLAVQPDGKIIVGGFFSFFNGTICNNIVRLNTDGSLDVSFNSGSGFTNNNSSFVKINSVFIQSNGKIIVGGRFSAYNGFYAENIVRLNIDGSLDNTFKTGVGFNGEVTSVLVQSMGKILVGGLFTSFNEVTSNRITRLNSDGTLDEYFNSGTGFNGAVNTISVQSDGKIIVGGSFSSFNEIDRNNIARLNIHGTLDGSFSPGTGTDDGFINSLIIQEDDKVIVGGHFTSFNGKAKFRIARLNVIGSLDDSFQGGFNDRVYSISLLEDGKIIVGGQFSKYINIERNSIARLNNDGSLDYTFDPGIGFNKNVYTTAIQPDGKIIIGGDFTSYNEDCRNRIARLDISTVGVRNLLNDQNISFHPNPTQGYGLFLVPKELIGNNITITNSLGEIIRKQEINDTHFNIDLNDSNRGVYFINITTNEGVFIRKIVKE